ncbi:MAG: hypothetical protein KDJ32_04695, partial [Alphaproteobacteria bacterium]|nr:hypothetical protein [Alphaproteobacteria bacterium]
MDANKFFGIFSRMTHIRAQQTHINPTQNPKQQRPQTTKRLNERGNVFFTLFGAVAIVGVLGAGIMSTMRGPLSTMVEVNRREQAKAEARVAASLVLVNASDEAVEIICEGGTIGVDEDGYTEGPEPVGGGGPTGGGTLPAVGAPQNDPWGNAYGYCAWDHGLAAADYSGCGNYLAGNVDTNNIAIAVLSAGPNGVFNTTCVDHAGGYMTPNTGGGGDDIVVSMTYNQAIAGSGGLWNLKATDPNIAEINKNLEVTGGGKFTDVLDLTDAAAQLQLGEKSLTLPTQATLTTCNGANENLLRINTGPNPDVVEICNEDDGSPGSFAWVSVAAGANLWSQNGSDIYYGSGNVGIGLNNPNDALDVVGTAEITGATILGSTLGVTGATTLSGTLAVTGTSALNNDVTITGGATGGTTDALSVRDSSASVIFTVQNDGTVGIGLSNPAEELDVSGDIQASGIYLLDGTQILSNGDDTSNILLGDVAAFSSSSNYMNLGDAIHADLTTANKRVGIGFADTYDVSAFNDTLEVNGTVDISDTLNVTNDTTVGGDLTVSGDDITMATNTAGHIMVADGTNFNPVAMSGDVAIDGTGATTIQNDAVQEDDIDASSFGAGTGATCLKTDGSSIFTEACSGGGGGDGLGGKGLPDVLANDNDAAGANAIGFGGVAIGSTTLSSGTATLELDVTGEIGATEYCDADGNNCFTTGEMNQDIAEVLGVGNNAGGATSLINLPGLAIGSTVFSTGAQTLEVDITGDVGATNYCDADGNNCFTAATVSGGGGGIWENASNVVRLSSSGAHANADFVFGSPQLEDDGNASHDSRIYFDKSKGAFRAGSATGNQWNYSSSGQYSVALGYDTTASGIYSTATGYGTVASNNWSTAIGATTVASGMASTAMGATTVASGMASITMGSSTTASGAIATAMGFDTVASGSTATAIGESTVASGSYSIAMGRDVIAGSGTAGDGSGDGSIAMGLRSPPAPIGTKPKITGDQSLGIFMGDQDGGVVMSSSNTLGLFGGRMILDPNVPATELSTSTGGEQDLEMDITGDLGAINYCDEDGNDCFTAADIAALSGSALPGAPDRGIQFNSGGNFAAEANFTYTSAGDLIVGSYQLDDTGTGSEDNRMFFDVSKGAFRAGGVGGTQWDDGNVGTYSTAMGAATTASGYYSTATGGATSASGILSTAMGYGVIAGSGTAGDGAGDGSFAIGLTDETVTITTPSQITGIQSMGIFMGDQDGLVMSASNTMGLFGGKMIIDPAVPATQLAASTGGEQDLELDVTGDIGAVNYCDADGNNCFTPDEVGTGVFEDNSGVIRSTSGTVNYTTADFVFGSPQLADDGDANHTSRMFFDKSKGAFRAGTATGARWDDANVGTYSAAFGYDVTASGNNSFATGNSVVVSGYAAFGVGEGLGVTGTHAAAIGQTITSSGWASFGQGQFIYALGNLSHASGYEAGASGVLGTARGNYASALGWGSTAWGNHVTASGDSAYALGLIASATTITTEPEVTGNQSMGIFMGDQDGGVDLSDANTLGLFGGRMVIDPNVPATNLSADTALEVDGTIKMAYGGEACDASREGAIHYNSSDNKFYLCKTAGSWDEITTGTPSAAAPDRGIQFNSGGNFAAEANFTYTSTGRLGIGTATPATTLDVTGTAAISSTLGVTGATTLASTLQVDGNITDSDSDVTINDGLKVTGSADIDTNLNVDGNTTLPTGTLAVASSTASTGGEQDLELDVTGDIGATNYCDADGNNCFTAAAVGTATAHGSDGYIQFNSANLLYSSAGLYWDNSNSRLGIGTTSPSSMLEIAGDITFTEGANRVIAPADKTTAANADALYVRAANHSSSATGMGGNLSLSGGNGYNSNGGGVGLYGGAGTAGSGGTGGGILISAGQAGTGFTGGVVNINGGIAGMGGVGGPISLTGGLAFLADGGDVQITGGVSSGGGESGSVTIDPGLGLAGSTEGYVVLAGNRGSVGIGTATPATKLDVAG